MSIQPGARQTKAEETKRKLTQTALELFRDFGYDTVTIDDICNRAGMTKGAFYHNFKSKEDLVVLHFNQMLDEHIRGRFRLDESQPILDQFCSLYMAVLDFGVVFGKEAVRRSYLSQISSCVYLKIPGRAYVDTLRSLVERGLREKAFRPQLRDFELYMLCTGTFTGLFMEWCTHEDGPGIPDWGMLMRTQLGLILNN